MAAIAKVQLHAHGLPKCERSMRSETKPAFNTSTQSLSGSATNSDGERIYPRLWPQSCLLLVRN